MDAETQKIAERIEALCLIARGNFPASTDIILSANGRDTASLKIAPYSLLKIVKAARMASDGKASA